MDGLDGADSPPELKKYLGRCEPSSSSDVGTAGVGAVELAAAILPLAESKESISFADAQWRPISEASSSDGEGASEGASDCLTTCSSPVSADATESPCPVSLRVRINGSDFSTKIEVPPSCRTVGGLKVQLEAAGLIPKESDAWLAQIGGWCRCGDPVRCDVCSQKGRLSHVDYAVRLRMSGPHRREKEAEIAHENGLLRKGVGHVGGRIGVGESTGGRPRTGGRLNLKPFLELKDEGMVLSELEIRDDDELEIIISDADAELDSLKKAWPNLF